MKISDWLRTTLFATITLSCGESVRTGEVEQQPVAPMIKGTEVPIIPVCTIPPPPPPIDSASYEEPCLACGMG